MASQDGTRIEIKIDSRAINYFSREAPERLVTAKKNAVTAMGMVWADEAKQITTDENHIDTGFYVNSIGYSTGSPSNPIHEMGERGKTVFLKIGANVPYAEYLEKRYSIMARGLDVAQDRMKRVAETQIKNALRL